MLEQGQKVYFAGEVRPYLVRAANEKFAVCTKPFAARRTVLYTVVDYRNQVRGTEDLIFGMGAETDKQCAAMLGRLTAGESAISRRNRANLSRANQVKESRQ